MGERFPGAGRMGGPAIALGAAEGPRPAWHAISERGFPAPSTAAAAEALSMIYRVNCTRFLLRTWRRPVPAFSQLAAGPSPPQDWLALGTGCGFPVRRFFDESDGNARVTLSERVIFLISPFANLVDIWTPRSNDWSARQAM
jgi:hypothetical protein